MNSERRNTPYLKPVPTPVARRRVTIESLRAQSWQRTLFVTGNPGLLAFVCVSDVEEQELNELFTEGHPRFVVDLRRTPRFDVGTLSRKRVFQMFSRHGTKYVDLSGALEIARRDSALNPDLLAAQLAGAIMVGQEPITGPIVLLVDLPQFSEDYVTRLSDQLQSIRAEGWEVLTVPSGKPSVQPPANTSRRTLLFLSHANPEDNDFALWLGSRLALAGYQVWSDVTKLIAGEVFWDSIEEAIREHSAKFVAIVSRASQQKNGVLDEISVAVAVERSRGIENFVVPIRLDDIPFDELRANLLRKNLVDFSENWAKGFRDLLSALDMERVPRGAVESDKFGNWSRTFTRSGQSLTRKPETITSNWLRLQALPRAVLVDNAPAAADSSIGGSAATPLSIGFSSSAAELAGLVGEQKSISIEEFLRDGWSAVGISPRESARIVSTHLRAAWAARAQQKGMLPYQISSGMTAWYAPINAIKGDKVSFRDSAGKVRRKHLLGRSEKRGVFWHYAIEPRISFGRHPRIMLASHVVFTEDGVERLVAENKMHRLRRQFCKNWWNDRWRDLLLGYLDWFSDSKATITLPLPRKEVAVVCASPMSFQSPVSVEVVGEAEHINKLVEELEWEDLDVVEPDEEVDDDDEV
jgi:hypothetical protein